MSQSVKQLFTSWVNMKNMPHRSQNFKVTIWFY